MEEGHGHAFGQMVEGKVKGLVAEVASGREANPSGKARFLEALQGPLDGKTGGEGQGAAGYHGGVLQDLPAVVGAVKVQEVHRQALQGELGPALGQAQVEDRLRLQGVEGGKGGGQGLGVHGKHGLPERPSSHLFRQEVQEGGGGVMPQAAKGFKTGNQDHGPDPPAIIAPIPLTRYKMGGVELGLVTDTAADLSPKVLQEEAVGTVPIYVHLMGRKYKDWQELTPDALYQAIRAGAEPVTEPPAVEDFVEVYERHLKVYDRLLSIHVSGELSKTVERAREAALRVAPNRIRVVDSGMVSAGLGAMVLRAVEMLKKGADEEEIVREMERLKRSSLYFSVADLSHLARNGRLPRFGEVVGNLLGLRPILRIEKGHIRFLKVARENSVPEALARLVLDEFQGRTARITIAHTDAKSEWVDGLKRALEGALRLERGRITRSGATIAANVGLGALAVHAYAVE